MSNRGENSRGALKVRASNKLSPHVRLGRDVVRRYALLFAWALVIVVFGVLRPEAFWSLENLSTVLGTQAVLLFLALVSLPAFVAGEYDLSIAGNLSFSLVLFGFLNVIQHWPLLPSAFVVLASGLVIGLINSLLIVGTGVPSLIVTLGMGTALGGLAVAVNAQTTGGVSETLVSLARTQVLGLPLAFFYALALTVSLWYFLVFTPTGRHLYFVGSGREVARLTGIRVNGLRVGVFLFSGVGASVAGLILAGSLGATDPNVGPSYLLPVFAAVFLGSTAIQPGRFNAWGTFAAVYFLVTGITGLQLVGLSGWVSDVFYGGSLAIAVTLSQLASKGD